MAGGRVGARVGGDGRTDWRDWELGVGGLPGSDSQASTADRTDRENWKIEASEAIKRCEL